MSQSYSGKHRDGVKVFVMQVWVGVNLVRLQDLLKMK